MKFWSPHTIISYVKKNSLLIFATCQRDNKMIHREGLVFFAFTVVLVWLPMCLTSSCKYNNVEYNVTYDLSSLMVDIESEGNAYEYDLYNYYNLSIYTYFSIILNNIDVNIQYCRYILLFHRIL